MCSETLHFENPIRYGVKRSICERTITNSNWSEMLHIFSCYYYFKSAAVSHDGGLLSAYEHNNSVGIGDCYAKRMVTDNWQHVLVLYVSGLSSCNSRWIL